MTYFPMFVDLKDKPVLVVGGGRVALRKLQKLDPYGAKPTVVAPEILDEIKELPNVIVIQRRFRIWDLYPRPALVIAATNDEKTNQKISLFCRKNYIPVNVTDNPAQCSFLFPALVQQGSFSAGISTGGASPTAAVYYKERLQELLPENIDEILSWLESQRQLLKTVIPEQSKRAGVFRRLFDACVEKKGPLTAEEASRYMDTSAVGSVALVGAGCGKADLITMRGLRLLQQCQAVVYDDLIDPALLEAVPEAAQRIYMGKRSGAHSASQSEINQKLIVLAKSGLKVVRLKGGDPYLFGRGGEEMMALKTAGIPCQEVPGIPSAIGIPAEAGIPVTHRGASRGLHIITAHTSDTEDGLPKDFDTLAKLSGTLVFLMGLKQLPKIVSRLTAAGKSGNTPAAVLSGGNAPNPVQVRAPLSKIVEEVKEANVLSPAIILVGDVAAIDLTFETNPLTGIRVGITGTKEVAEKQQSALRELGAETIWVARSMVKELPLKIDLQRLNKKPCWLVFTSANGVNVFFNHLEQQKINLHTVQKMKFAVIGSATGKALVKHGIFPNLCPEVFTSKGLANVLISAAKRDEEIILLRSSIGSSILPHILEKEGFSVRDIAIYDLETEDTDQNEFPELDYLTFSSASGVESFLEKFNEIPKEVSCVCIGDVTAKALSKYRNDFLIANEISVNGIVQTILEDYGRARV